MAAKKKHLCKLVKENILNENIEKYIKKVKNPKFVCHNCGRVAKKSDLLCKPTDITL